MKTTLEMSVAVGVTPRRLLAIAAARGVKPAKMIGRAAIWSESDLPRLKPGKPGRPAGAFTLIELLVVIAIVAVLVALIGPALAGTREAGRRGKCLANLRILATGAAQYVDQYRHLPAWGDETDEFTQAYGGLRCPSARFPDEGGYVMPVGVGGMAGGFTASTWIGRNQVQNPSTVSVVYCWRHAKGLNGFLDGHAR